MGRHSSARYLNLNCWTTKNIECKSDNGLRTGGRSNVRYFSLNCWTTKNVEYKSHNGLCVGGHSSARLSELLNGKECTEQEWITEFKTVHDHSDRTPSSRLKRRRSQLSSDSEICRQDFAAPQDYCTELWREPNKDYTLAEPLTFAIRSHL